MREIASNYVNDSKGRKVASIEKVCVIRGDTYMARRIIGWLRFNWDAEAKTWYRSVMVDKNGVGDFSYENSKGVKEVLLTAERLHGMLVNESPREIKVSVSFE